jgi:hypothetical protein
MMNGVAPVLDSNRAFRVIWVSVTGNVTVLGLAPDGVGDGNTVTYANVPVGLHAIGGKKIVSATTTATVGAIQPIDG